MSGQNNRKTGSKIEVGKWAGYPIFTLTLEERVTCPEGCYHWYTCMGNGMPFSRRHVHGDDFERVLEEELARHDKKYSGFVVRLHILGDFYSLHYVALWGYWIKRFSSLHVFGYTAHDRYSPIGSAVYSLREREWDRFAIRFSKRVPEDFNREVVSGDSKLSYLDAVECPAQLSDNKFCGNCGICWRSDKNVVFKTHGRI